ncbi:MAG: hypothetical protein KDE27_01380 [Planctomycetes bacterium]|nr:hypothetical protein [Planctomycetota bacterium]
MQTRTLAVRHDTARHGSLATLAVATLVMAATPAQTVWTVAAAGGGSFTTIQPAINAAVDGDVIIVESGTYTSGSFVINDKALTIIEEAGHTATFVSASITNPNGKTVAIRGLDFLRNSPGVNGLNPGRNLHVVDNTGTVWLEDCTFRTGPGSAGAIIAAVGPAYPAIETANSLSSGGQLVMTRCIVEGSDSVRLPGGMMEASVGVLGNVYAGDAMLLYDTTITGGDGANGFVGTGLAGSNGATAAVVAKGLIFMSGCTLTGGDGGNGGSSGGACTNGGNGGDGLAITSTGLAEDLGSTLTGGAGGTAPGGCTPGAAGTAWTGPAGALTTYTSGQPHSVEVTAPVQDNTSTTASFVGEASSPVAPAYSPSPSLTKLPGVIGWHVLDLSTTYSLPGTTLNAAGTGTVVYPLNNVIAPGAQAAVVFVQSVVAGATSSTLVEGAPSVLVVKQ